MRFNGLLYIDSRPNAARKICSTDSLNIHKRFSNHGILCKLTIAPLKLDFDAEKKSHLSSTWWRCGKERLGSMRSGRSTDRATWAKPQTSECHRLCSQSLSGCLGKGKSKKQPNKKTMHAQKNDPVTGSQSLPIQRRLSVIVFVST